VAYCVVVVVAAAVVVVAVVIAVGVYLDPGATA
jgi:hypothetical protein